MKKYNDFTKDRIIIPRVIVFFLLVVSLCVSFGFAAYNAVEALGWATMASEFKSGFEGSQTDEYLREKISVLEERLEELRNQEKAE